MLWSLLLTAKFFITALTFAPTPVEQVNLTGQWEGVFTQDRNGERIDFKCEIYIFQKGKTITGKSVVHDAEIHAEMTFEGKLLDNRILRCHETSILRQETRPNMEWCMKTYDMIYKAEKDLWRLEGLWEGDTTFGPCTPGRVFLKKVVPRA